MNNLTEIIVEQLLEEGYDLHQIEEYIDSEEFDQFLESYLEEAGRLKRLTKATGDVLGLREPSPYEKAWGGSKKENRKELAKGLAAQAAMGATLGGLQMGAKGAAFGAALATTEHTLLSIRDRYKHLKSIGEENENINENSREDNIWDLYYDHKDFHKANKHLNDSWKIAKTLPAKQAESFMKKIKNKWEHVGANDSEPNEVLHNKMKKHFGNDYKRVTRFAKWGSMHESESENINENLLSKAKKYITGKSRAKDLIHGLESKNRLYSNLATINLNMHGKRFKGDRSHEERPDLDPETYYKQLDNDNLNKAKKFSKLSLSAANKTWKVKKLANIKEEFSQFDIEGLTEELLMEIKMKLKPGQKMTPKQFAKMKEDVLAKQKEKKAAKEAKKNAPPKEEAKVETDDNNRNARILKGQFPWGNVSQAMSNSALAKLKMIEKPTDRLNAIEAIWSDSKHFHDLVRHGKVDYKHEKPKTGPSLPKVRGID